MSLKASFAVLVASFPAGTAEPGVGAGRAAGLATIALRKAVVPGARISFVAFGDVIEGVSRVPWPVLVG